MNNSIPHSNPKDNPSAELIHGATYSLPSRSYCDSYPQMRAYWHRSLRYWSLDSYDPKYMVWQPQLVCLGHALLEIVRKNGEAVYRPTHYTLSDLRLLGGLDLRVWGEVVGYANTNLPDAPGGERKP